MTADPAETAPISEVVASVNDAGLLSALSVPSLLEHRDLQVREFCRMVLITLAASASVKLVLRDSSAKQILQAQADKLHDQLGQARATPSCECDQDDIENWQEELEAVLTLLKCLD